MLIEHHQLEDRRGEIMRLLDHGCDELDQMERLDETRWPIHDQEKRIKWVLGYLHAANAMLDSAPQLYDSMIELPQFMRLRKLQRTMMRG